MAFCYSSLNRLRQYRNLLNTLFRNIGSARNYHLTNAQYTLHMGTFLLLTRLQWKYMVKTENPHAPSRKSLLQSKGGSPKKSVAVSIFRVAFPYRVSPPNTTSIPGAAASGLTRWGSKALPFAPTQSNFDRKYSLKDPAWSASQLNFFLTSFVTVGHQQMNKFYPIPSQNLV